MSTKVVGGPGKFDLMVAFFDGDCRNRRNVTFVTGISGKVTRTFGPVVINSMEREDGSGESWNISGYEMNTNKKFKMLFSTKTRQGSYEYVS